ncbi:hypothetical protein KPaMU14_04910 [Kocuria palustris]|nr:hypothetical protein KPaMU14_04910 [Kocuria palustris]
MRRVREAQDLRQSDLAAELSDFDMTRVKIAKIEAGTRPTPLEEATAIAAVLNVSLAELLDYATDDFARDAAERVRAVVKSQEQLNRAALDLESRVEAVRLIPDDVAARMPKRWRSLLPWAKLSPEEYLNRWMPAMRDTDFSWRDDE